MKELYPAAGFAIAAADSPVPGVLLPPDLLVLVLIFYPPKTRLLRDTQAAGDAVQNGELMLLHQGAAAFSLWTGQAAPLELMQRKLEEARAGGIVSAEGEPVGTEATSAAAQ